MQKIITFGILLIIVGVTAVISFLKGVDKVRNGLIANYPTVKNLIQGATTEFLDSTLVISISKADNEELFNLLRGNVKSDTIEVAIPYYARYGVDLAVRNFRVFRDEQTVEVWLPDTKVVNCELRFDRMRVNGEPNSSAIKGENFGLLRQRMYEHLLPVLEKNKANKKAAKTTVAKAVMFYFMPYKFDLKLYINEELQTLPMVPGVNQTPEEAINQYLGR